MAMSKPRKGGKKSWSPSSAASPQASGSSWRFGFSAVALALSFLLGFATAAVLHAWLSAPQAVIYWTAKDAET